MVNARLSSKGQVVIPKRIREELKMKTGTQLRIRVVGKKVILEPLERCARERLYGKYRNVPLLEDLEAEHAEEIAKDTHS